MHYTAKNIHHYLIDKGYLPAEALINGEYLIKSQNSRNAIFSISGSASSNLFVKQLKSTEPQNIYLMQKEATALHLIFSSALYKQTKTYSPNYFGYDPQQHILVLENIEGSRNLHEHIMGNRQFNEEHAAQMARILASFHFDISTKIADNRSLQFFRKEIPWMLNLSNLPNIDSNFNLNPVPKFIKQHAGLTYLIDELRYSWQATSLIHGDIKWMNFLLKPNEEMMLIDWEIADIGDPLWDVAGVLQSYLIVWAYSFVNQLNAYQKLPGQEFIDPKNMQPSIRRFWESYSEHMKLTGKEKKEALEKAIKYTAVRMLQTAFEAHNMDRKLSPNSIRLIQLSENILKSPIEVAGNLLGMN